VRENAQKEVKIRINFVVVGEPAQWLKTWKQRGIVTSYTDAVLQALRNFHYEITDRELKTAQLQNMRQAE
jgi:hypothetical protein